MATTGNRLCELGMIPIVAREVVTQFQAGVGNSLRFVGHGVVPPLASELARLANLSAGARTFNGLIERGMPADLAKEVVS